MTLRPSLTRYIVLLGIVCVTTGTLLFRSNARSQTLTLGSVSGIRGQSVWFDVTLSIESKSIAGTQNDITFNGANIPIGTCVKNDQLTKDVSLTFLPAGCTGAACTSVRIIFSSMSDNSALDDLIVLYRCRVDIPSGAALGNYPLTISNVSGGDPVGNFVAMTGVNGQVTVGCSGCC